MWDDEVHIYNIIAQYERYMQYYIYDYTNIVYWHHTNEKMGLLCLHSMITCWVSFISGSKGEYRMNSFEFIGNCFADSMPGTDDVACALDMPCRTVGCSLKGIVCRIDGCLLKGVVCRLDVCRLLGCRVEVPICPAAICRADVVIPR